MEGFTLVTPLRRGSSAPRTPVEKPLATLSVRKPNKITEKCVATIRIGLATEILESMGWAPKTRMAVLVSADATKIAIRPAQEGEPGYALSQDKKAKGVAAIEFTWRPGLGLVNTVKRSTAVQLLPVEEGSNMVVLDSTCVAEGAPAEVDEAVHENLSEAA